MDTVLKLLDLFGVTPTTRPFFFLGVLVIVGFIYMRISIGKPISKMKDNLLVLITHMASSRGKLDTSLIKQMSPLQIQPAGQKILQEVGFPKIFEDNKEKFFSIIRNKKPETKLEVESYSIYSFIEIMTTDGILNRVKVYLYEHPNIRETFPTLAGVYIRDKFLEENPKIKE